MSSSQAARLTATQSMDIMSIRFIQLQLMKGTVTIQPGREKRLTRTTMR